MRRLNRITTALPAGLFLLGLLIPLAADPAHAWTREEMERFLATADAASFRPLAEGVTNTVRVTLTQGVLAHDAQIQQVDVSKRGDPAAGDSETTFHDYWGFNVAAYKLSRLLELDAVPVSVQREIDGKPAAFTWWIDDVLMTEKMRYTRKINPPDKTAWNRQIYCVRVFDRLIDNSDRNLGNLVITNDWKVWMIDHTRAFRVRRQLENPAELRMCERGLLAALRRLDQKTLTQELGEYLDAGQIGALLARRDRIVEHFDREVSSRGEQTVIFEAPR